MSDVRRNEDGSCWECDVGMWDCECGRQMRGLGWEPLPAAKPVPPVVLVTMYNRAAHTSRVTMATHQGTRFQLIENALGRPANPDERLVAWMTPPRPYENVEHCSTLFHDGSRKGLRHAAANAGPGVDLTAADVEESLLRLADLDVTDARRRELQAHLERIFRDEVAPQRATMGSARNVHNGDDAMMTEAEARLALDREP